MMPIKLIRIIKISICCILLILLFTQCDEFLPNDFRQEDFQIVDLDARACEYLSRDLFKLDSVTVDTITSYFTDTLAVFLSTSNLLDIIDTTQFADSLDITDSLIISEKFDELIQKLDPMIEDTTMSITNPNGQNVCYVSYTHTANNKTTYFYVGWKYKWLADLNTDNIDAFVDIDLINKDVGLVARATDNITLEMSSGCTQYVAWRDNFFPTIKAKNAFTLEKGDYLVSVELAIINYKIFNYKQKQLDIFN